MMKQYEVSPCVFCTRVRNPEDCENKNCPQWRAWFLAKWALLHSYPRRLMDAPRTTCGLQIGGQRYAHPVQVQDYRHRDPCQTCRCGADLCRTPCRARQNWAVNGGGAPQ